MFSILYDHRYMIRKYFCIISEKMNMKCLQKEIGEMFYSNGRTECPF